MKINIKNAKYLFLMISFLLISYTLLTKEVKSEGFQRKMYSEKNDSIFRIIRIDSIENVYLVYAERNDSIFKILSKKINCFNCRQIRLGEFYDLKLSSWFLPEEIHLRMRMTGVKFENVIVKIERESIVSDLFLTKNLEGLCYVLKPYKTIENKKP